MRRSEWPGRNQAALFSQARHGVDFGCLQRFLEFERRQYRRYALGQHRLARTRRPDHQYVVRAGGSDLERPLGMKLAPHFAKVLGVLAEVRQQRISVDSYGYWRLIAIDHVYDTLERAYRMHVQAGDDGRFLRILFGQQ